MSKTAPGLFGQTHSNRDYTKEKTWGKNQFNSSFPASLIAYMSYKGIDPVYVCLDKKQNVIHKTITGAELFGLDPLSDSLYYGFESNYFPYNKFYTGKSERIDLVLSNRNTDTPLRGFEVKLTALPDSTTKDLTEDKYSCEIVVRPPTICFAACSICSHYSTAKAQQRLRELLAGVPLITHWEMIEEVSPHYAAIRRAVLRVMDDMTRRQSPLIIQPVWKTNGKTFRLTDDCLDAFVWSDIAVVKMCIDEPSPTIRGVNRPMPDGYKVHTNDPVPTKEGIRALTTVERSYIQTFPQDFRFAGSKTNIEQMIGNAVPVNLASYVANSISKYISTNSSHVDTH